LGKTRDTDFKESRDKKRGGRPLRRGTKEKGSTLSKGDIWVGTVTNFLGVGEGQENKWVNTCQQNPLGHLGGGGGGGGGSKEKF